MKLKYYTEIVLKLILISIVATIFITGTANAALLTSSITPSAGFKCQAFTISSTFNDVGITSVYAILSTDKAVQPGWQSGSNIPISESTNITMTYNGTYWVGTFGNDATLLWSTRSITYYVYNGGLHIYPSSTDVLVYSDACTGTGVTSYKNVSNGIGMPYTDALLTTDISLYDWLMSPYLAIIGVLFYFLIIILIVFMTWMKSKNYISTTLVAVLLILAVSGTQYVPPEYRGGILIIISLAITALLAIVFVKRGQ